MRLLCVLVMTLLIAVGSNMPAYAGMPQAPAHEQSAWTGSYWNNTDFAGQAVVTRTDGNINFDWGHSSPDYRINTDRFAARWTRWVSFNQGEYIFSATSDDGVRLSVDGRMVINEWYGHSAQTYQANVTLSPGDHYIMVEYYEDTGSAQIVVTWQAPEITIRGWRGEYFNQPNPGGTPVLIQNDDAIAFNWGNNSPEPGTIYSDNFSVRWTRSLNLPSGWYKFVMTVDDGGKLWINNQLILDRWQVQSQQTFTANYFHSGGVMNMRMEYYDAGGAAVAYLSWTQSDVSIRNWKGEYFNSTGVGGTPALVRDDNDIDFNWGSGSPAPGIIGDDRFSARWTRSIDLPAGRYRFTAIADDGVRLWVNDQLMIDAWRIQPPSTFAAEVNLRGGSTQIRLEYYEESSGAQITLQWARVASEYRNWRGEYYNNISLAGTPVLLRDDADVAFDWGTASPAPGVVGIDAFSVRWSRSIDFPAGWYRFKVKSDDGSRLYVGDKLLINAWQMQVAQTYTADVYVSGETLIRLEYYDQSGLAMVKMAWEPVAVTIQNWRAEYYNSISLTGQPVLLRDESTINYNWGDLSPAPGIVNADLFSARWTRDVSLPEGWHRFTMLVDDGGRLWVNNRLLIDAWIVQGPRPYEADIYIPGGTTSIRMEYFENSGWSSAQLAWRVIGGSSRPELTIVDDTDPGFERVTGSQDWQTAPEGYGNRLTWTRTRATTQSDTNTGRWRARLAQGRYEVYAYIPNRYTTTSQARYIISSSAGRSFRVVNQSGSPDRWISLGIYDFAGGDRDYIELSDFTTETAGTLLMAFDAVKWEPR